MNACNPWATCEGDTARTQLGTQTHTSSVQRELHAVQLPLGFLPHHHVDQMALLAHASVLPHIRTQSPCHTSPQPSSPQAPTMSGRSTWMPGTDSSTFSTSALPFLHAIWMARSPSCVGGEGWGGAESPELRQVGGGSGRWNGMQARCPPPSIPRARLFLKWLACRLQVVCACAGQVAARIQGRCRDGWVGGSGRPPPPQASATDVCRSLRAHVPSHLHAPATHALTLSGCVASKPRSTSVRTKPACCAWHAVWMAWSRACGVYG